VSTTKTIAPTKKPKTETRISVNLQILINTAVAAENEFPENPTLTSYYEKCMNQAMVDGWPTHKISAKLLKEMDQKLYKIRHALNTEIHEEECKINRSLWHRIARKLGCSDPKYITNLKEKGLHTVEPKNSSNPKQENINFDSFQVLSHLINLCQEVQKKIKANPDLMFEIIPKPIRDNFYLESHTLIKNIGNTFNEKLKIPVNTEQLFVDIFSNTCIALVDAAEQFVLEKTKMLKSNRKKLITLKQTNKFLFNTETSKLYIFFPHNMQQAIFDGFVGIPCVSCNSWKVRHPTNDPSNAVCQKCLKIFPAINLPRCSNCHLPFYRENIIKIIENNSCCPQCKNPIILYEDLKMWALSTNDVSH